MATINYINNDRFIRSIAPSSFEEKVLWPTLNPGSSKQAQIAHKVGLIVAAILLSITLVGLVLVVKITKAFSAYKEKIKAVTKTLAAAKIQGIVRGHQIRKEYNSTLPFDTPCILSLEKVVRLRIRVKDMCSDLKRYQDSIFSEKRISIDPFFFQIVRRKKSSIQGGYILGNTFNRALLNDSHFQRSDILLLAKKSIGMRHVSSEEVALQEREMGVLLGCSFNLTFQKSEHDWDRGFETLPQEVASISSPEEKISAYEKAVSNHIRQSIMYDIEGVFFNRITVRTVIEKIKNTRFLFIDYSAWGRPTDFNLWHGLGRFPKLNVAPEEIKAVLFFDTSKTELNKLDEEIENGFQFDILVGEIVDYFQAIIINYLRSNYSHFGDRIVS